MDLSKASFYKPEAFVIFKIVANSMISIDSHFDISDKSNTLVFGKIQTFEAKEESFLENITSTFGGIWQTEVSNNLKLWSFLSSLQIPFLLQIRTYTFRTNRVPWCLGKPDLRVK